MTLTLLNAPKEYDKLPNIHASAAYGISYPGVTLVVVVGVVVACSYTAGGAGAGVLL